MKQILFLFIFGIACVGRGFEYIGIPEPDWDWDVSAPALPDPWTSTQPGFYFVNNQTGSDSGNPLGDPTQPRSTVPNPIPAGSVVVVDGTYSDNSTFQADGTTSFPVFLVAANPTSPPIFTKMFEMRGAYFMVSDIDLEGVDGALRLNGHHLTFKNSRVTDPDTGYGAAVSGTGHHIVFYQNVVGPVGNYQHQGADIDHHGWKVNSSDTWIIDSQFHHCQGDGVQIGDANNSPSEIVRVYVAGNEYYSNLQTGLWIKNAEDVIVSQNIFYDHNNEGGGSVPVGTGGQYDFSFAWWIANLVYNSRGGIHVASSLNGGGHDRYIIGNIIRDVLNPGLDVDDPHKISAICNRGGASPDMHILFNTIYNCSGGINVPNGNNTTIQSNIIGQPTAIGARHIYSPDGSSSLGDVDYNLYVGSNPIIGWGGREGSLLSLVANTPHGDHGITSTTGGFLDANARDFRPEASSPAVDAGGITEEPAFALFESRYGVDIRVDYRELQRPIGSEWDIGAFEFSDAKPPPSNLRRTVP